METAQFSYSFLLIGIFILGYIAIILEHIAKVNKTAIALLLAVILWGIFFKGADLATVVPMRVLGEYVADVSQIIFFIMGAMTLVEVVDCHNGFKVVTDLIATGSQRKLLWLIAIFAFFLSSVLDNLTTTILMISLLRKLVPNSKERFIFSCLVVIAANAGGAWTPIGDVTTTMLWIENRISTLEVMKALFLPSLISLLIPLGYFHFKVKGRISHAEKQPVKGTEPGATLIFLLGIGALVFVPIFKGWTGLPPFVGMLFGLSLMWILTDLIHHENTMREHLRIPRILSRIDLPAVLFFMGILLAVDALQAAGLLRQLADWLNAKTDSQVLIATAIGLFSAIMDNVPLVAATIGMYPLSEVPLDNPLWHMIAYAAGTGGSILIIGSAAGIALMGMERIPFFPYLKKITLPTLIGFLAGMGFYVLFH